MMAYSRYVTQAHSFHRLIQLRNNFPIIQFWLHFGLKPSSYHAIEMSQVTKS